MAVLQGKIIQHEAFGSLKNRLIPLSLPMPAVKLPPRGLLRAVMFVCFHCLPANGCHEVGFIDEPS